MDPPRPDNRAAWDALAAAYNEHVGWPDDAVTWGFRAPPEAELRILGDVSGRATLVLGCGGGQDLVALAAMGAAPLTGLDLSPEQLAHARRRLTERGVDATLVEGDIADLSAFGDASFELVVSVQAMNYVERVDDCFAEIARVLAPGGRLAFSVLHPADISTEDAPPYGWKKSYFATEVDWQWDQLADEDVSLRSWFPTVSDWFEAVTRAGLTVDRLVEPRPVDDPRWRETWLSDESYAKLEVVPSTLIVAATR